MTNNSEAEDFEDAALSYLAEIADHLETISTKLDRLTEAVDTVGGNIVVWSPTETLDRIASTVDAIKRSAG